MSDLPPVVRIRWLDSVLLDGWRDLVDLRDSANTVVVHTFGFLVAEDATYMTVAAAIHGHEAAGVIRIPVASILTREAVS